MPSLYDAHWRYVNLYLSVVEKADQFYSKEVTQGVAISIFDHNREQIDNALNWIIRQRPTKQFDILLVHFVDVLSTIGMARYSVREKLIPLMGQQVAATKRLGQEYLEANSLDGLGIMYAFLGFLPRAIQYFERAHEIADQINDEELKQDIQTRIKLAQEQIKNENVASLTKFLGLIRLVLLKAKLLFIDINKKPFVEISILNDIANIYLSWEKWDVAIQYCQRAILKSQKLSYRFGELEASMGLMLAKTSKGESNPLLASMVNNLSSDFAWDIDMSVLEILLEIAPVIKQAEAIANHLANKNAHQAKEIYSHLDQVMLNTDEIISAMREVSAQKHEILIAALRNIKCEIAMITEICSNNSSQSS